MEPEPTDPVSVCNNLYFQIKEGSYKSRSTDFFGVIKKVAALPASKMKGVDEAVVKELKEIRGLIKGALKECEKSNTSPSVQLQWLCKLMMKNGTKLGGKEVDEETRQLALQHFGLHDVHVSDVKKSPEFTLLQKIHDGLLAVPSKKKSQVKNVDGLRKLVVEVFSGQTVDDFEKVKNDYSDVVQMLRAWFCSVSSSEKHNDLLQSNIIKNLVPILEKAWGNDLGETFDRALEYFGFPHQVDKKRKRVSETGVGEFLKSPSGVVQKNIEKGSLEKRIKKDDLPANVVPITKGEANVSELGKKVSRLGIVSSLMSGVKWIWQKAAAAVPNILPAKEPMTKNAEKFKEHLQGVYSLANGEAFLLYDKLASKGVLALKVPRIDEDGVKSMGYVKLRNLEVSLQKPHPDHKKEWIEAGNPPVIFIKADKFREEVVLHNKPEKYGPFQTIQTAVKSFEKNCNQKVKQRVVSDHVGSSNLAIIMDANGTFHSVDRRSTPLGMGTYKVVRLETVLSEIGSWDVASARLYKDTEEIENIAELVEEMKLTQALRQSGVPHILSMSARPGQDVRKTRIEMDKMDGNFEDLAGKDMSEVSLGDRFQYMADIADALAHMHDLDPPVVHNDLKLGNLLFKGQEGLLSDFGLTTKLSDPSLGGTFPSPEYLRAQTKANPRPPATAQNDCWAFGIALYTMIHWKAAQNNVPYAHYSMGAVSVENARNRIVATLNSQNPADKLIIDLLSLDPSKRPSMKDVFADLNGFILDLYRDKKVFGDLKSGNVSNITDVKFWQKDELSRMGCECLSDVIARENVNPAIKKKRLRYMSQLATTLSKMHKQHISHNGLVVKKILISKKGDRVLVSDFRTSTNIGDPIPNGAVLPPECLDDDVDNLATEKNDCWAYGVLLYQATHGPQSMKIADNVRSANPADFPQAMESLMSQLNKNDPVDQLIRGLLSESPASRPSMDKVVQTLQEIEKKGMDIDQL